MYFVVLIVTVLYSATGARGLVVNTVFRSSISKSPIRREGDLFSSLPLHIPAPALSLLFLRFYPRHPSDYLLAH
jgi:hypothetical protein